MTDRKTKAFARTRNLSRLRQLVDHHGGKVSAVSTALGYSTGAAKAWLDAGEMPVSVDLACEALVRRLGSTLRASDLVVAVLPAEKAKVAADVVADVVAAMRGTVLEVVGGTTVIAQVPADVTATLFAMIERFGGTIKKVTAS